MKGRQQKLVKTDRRRGPHNARAEGPLNNTYPSAGNPNPSDVTDQCGEKCWSKVAKRARKVKLPPPPMDKKRRNLTENVLFG